jgi:hypothetical protein
MVHSVISTWEEIQVPGSRKRRRSSIDAGSMRFLDKTLLNVSKYFYYLLVLKEHIVKNKRF